MHDRIRKGTARALAAILLLLCAGAAGAAPRDLVGKRAPAISGRQVNGEPWSLSAHAGKVPVLLTFWSIYCKACTEELSALEGLVGQLGPGRVAVAAVNEDGDVGIGRVQNFLANFGAVRGKGKLSFPVIFDQKGEIFRAYSVARLPTLFYIDERGTVREVVEGFEPGRELAVSAAIQKLVADLSAAKLREVADEAVFDLEVSAPICGIYRDGKWHRPLDLDESGRPEAIARARARGEAHLRREAIRSALSGVGVSLRGEERLPECGVPYGSEIGTPWVPRDTIDLLLEKLSLPRVMEVLSQETIERERDLVLYRRIRILLPGLLSQMEAAGYSNVARTFTVRFVRASLREERGFAEAVRNQFPFLGGIEKASSPKAGTEYRITAYASPEAVVRALRALDVGPRKLSVDLLPGDLLEVAMWR